MNNTNQEFGYLPFDVTIYFGGYTVYTKPGLKETFQELKELTDSDGFIHPPLENTYSLSQDRNEYIERQKRPGTLLKVRAGNSHVISLISGYPLPENFKQRDGAFIIGLLSLIYRTRLQFKEWFHEGKFCINPDGICLIRNAEEFNFLGHKWKAKDELSDLFKIAFSKWATLNEEAKGALLNALYFHCKAPFYDWGYERFFADYVAIDAIWRVGEIDGIWKDKDRRKRRYKINKPLFMLNRLGMYDEKKYFGSPTINFGYCRKLLQETRAINKARNNLFHEGRWDSNNRISIAFENMIVYKMHRYLQRLLLAFLGIKNNYTHSTWWHSGSISWN